MAAENRELEVRGDNVEKAVEAGLVQLGLTRNDVIIEVLDEGSGGFLGIGSRDAIVRLTVKVQPEKPPAAAPPVKALEAAPEAAPEATRTAVPEATAEPPAPQRMVETAPERPAAPVTAERTPSDEEEDMTSEEEGQVAQEIVNTLLEKMQVQAETTLSLSDPDDLTNEQRWVIGVEGNDLGALIGPRGETLNALQYVSRLMTGHRLHQRPHFIVDVEGYRSRREQALARLAERMAKKVVARGKPLNLEPMPPNERRIIHMTLRDHEQVFTESKGEGSRRQVRILLKR